VTVVLRFTDGTTLDLGQSIPLMSAFGEMGKFDPDGKHYGELFYVPRAEEDGEPLPDAWRVKAAQQAREFLHEHGGQISGDAQRILAKITTLGTVGG